MQNIPKIASYLGFAVRAGKVLWGVENVTAKPRRRKVILMCPTTAENTSKQVKAYCQKTGSPLIELEGATLEFLLKRNGKVLAVTDDNLAKAILANANMKEEVQSNE